MAIGAVLLIPEFAQNNIATYVFQISHLCNESVLKSAKNCLFQFPKRFISNTIIFYTQSLPERQENAEYKKNEKCDMLYK